MKLPRLPLCVALASCYALSGPAQAAVQWSEEYQGYQLIETPWTVTQPTRMSTEPGETWLEIKGSLGDAYVQIDAPDYAPETQSTLAFTLTITKQGTTGRWAQGAMIFVDGYAWEIRVDTNRVSLAGSITREYTASIGLNVTHQYHFVINDGTASLYIDSMPVEGFQNIAGNPGFPSISQVLRLGDYGGNLTGDGRWDDVKWHNSEVLPVPEPGSVALLIGAGMAMIGGIALKRCGSR